MGGDEIEFLFFVNNRIVGYGLKNCCYNSRVNIAKIFFPAIDKLSKKRKRRRRRNVSLNKKHGWVIIHSKNYEELFNPRILLSSRNLAMRFTAYFTT